METTRLTVTTEEAGQRADSLLAQRLEGLTRSAAARLLEEGRVTDRGRPVAKNLRVQPGQVLEVTLPEPEEPEARPQNIPLDVVYEDQDVIVVNKPTGMVVHPAPPGYRPPHRPGHQRPHYRRQKRRRPPGLSGPAGGSHPGPDL